MSALARCFCGCDNDKKLKEVVNDEDNDVDSGVCVVPSSHFTYAVHDVHLLSERVCWRLSTLRS